MDGSLICDGNYDCIDAADERDCSKYILKLINDTDRKLDVVFSRDRGFSFTITLMQRPKGVSRMLSVSVFKFNADCAVLLWVSTSGLLRKKTP